MKVKGIHLISILMKGILAGFLIGIGGFLYLHSPNKVIGSLLFPIGLYLICKCDAYLYTGKVEFSIDEIFKYRNKSIIFDLILGLIGNTIGASLMGYLYRYIGDITALYVVTSRGFDVPLDTLFIFLKSLLCGILVYIAVFLYKKSKKEAGEFIGIFLPIFTFVLCGFRHCIADIFYIFATFEFSWNVLISWVITLLGNTLGAVLFDFVLNKIKEI